MPARTALADRLEDPAQGRRERKKQATWLALHEAAVALSVEHGFERVTVEGICDRADVSVRTFFNYFACKEDAVLGGSAGFEEVRDSMLARPADEAPLEAFRNAYVAKARRLGDRGEAIRTRYRLIQQHDQLRAREFARLADFERSLAEVIAQRVGVDPDTDPYPALVASVGMAVLRTSFARWQAGGNRESIATLVDRGFTAVMAGLPAPPPRRRRPAAPA